MLSIQLSIRHLSNASVFMSLLLTLLIIYHALTESGNSGKLCYMLSITLTIQRPYMAIQETSSHAFRDTDDPTTIYADSGKPRYMFSVTLMIQRPYMADLGYYRKLSCHTRL